jgi:SAM-dependent methyltransferase
MWQPGFACPQCGAAVREAGSQRVACVACRQVFERQTGIWRFLTASRRDRLEPFLQQYRIIRQHDGRRPPTPQYYRRLPMVRDDDPNATEWRIRRETYHNLLLHVFRGDQPGFRVLDVGAGSGWLSHRLTALGHRAVAVDIIDDEADGLGAARHYSTTFPVVQADFDAPPFASRQFDVVVFNGSLHYSADPAATLERAHRLLAEGGTLVVMDSPMFVTAKDGAAMVDDNARRFRSTCGLAEVVRPGVGFLTYAGLTAIAEREKLRARFVRSRGSINWRVHRLVSRIRLRRAPASFGLWMAR